MADSPGDNIVEVEPQSFIPVDSERIKKMILEKVPVNSQKPFAELAKLLEAMSHYKHMEERKRLQANFKRCCEIACSEPGVVSKEEDSATSKDFVLGLRSLMKRGNFHLLSHEDFARCQDDGFLLDYPMELDNSKSDPAFLSAAISGTNKFDGCEHFQGTMLVFHRGVGIAKKKGSFYAEKAALLQDKIVGEPFMALMHLMTGGLFKPKKEPAYPSSPTKSLKRSTSTTKLKQIYVERKTLKRLLPTIMSLVKNMFVDIELQEPVYKEVVLLYRKKESESSELADGVENRVILKSFIEVPMADLELCFPETKVNMPPGQIFQSFAMILMAIFSVLMSAIAADIINDSNWQVAVLAVMGTLGAKIATEVGKVEKLMKQLGYQKSLALYSRSRNSQEGVVYYISEMMEEQELSQMLLAYYVLLYLFDSRGCRAEDLDDKCEQLLVEWFNVEIDFNVNRVLQKLQNMNVISCKVLDGEEKFAAAPLKTALARLDSEWDSFFEYTPAEKNSSPANGTPGTALQIAEMSDLQDELAKKDAEIERLKKQQVILCDKIKMVDKEMAECDFPEAGETLKLRKQQKILCLKIKQLEEAMAGLVD